MMKQYLRKLTHFAGVAVLFLMMLVWSCTPTIYFPNSLNVPMLSEEGQLSASAAITANGFDPQMAYAITDNIGIMGNLQLAPSSLGDYPSHYLGEVGVGYFVATSSIFRFEVFGGGGYGWINERVFDDEYLTPNTSMLRWFIQPTMGIGTDYFDFGFSARFVVPGFYEQGSAALYTSFFEPAITIKAGKAPVKGFFQVGYAIPLGMGLLIGYQPTIVALGLELSLRREELSRWTQRTNAALQVF